MAEHAEASPSLPQISPTTPRSSKTDALLLTTLELTHQAFHPTHLILHSTRRDAAYAPLVLTLITAAEFTLLSLRSLIETPRTKSFYVVRRLWNGPKIWKLRREMECYVSIFDLMILCETFRQEGVSTSRLGPASSHIHSSLKKLYRSSWYLSSKTIHRLILVALQQFLIEYNITEKGVKIEGLGEKREIPFTYNPLTTEQLKSSSLLTQFKHSHQLLRNNCRLLHMARSGNIQKLEKLLQQGAQIETRDFHSRTPLFHAVTSANLEAVKFLLEKGASINVSDIYGSTILGAARTCGNEVILKAIEGIVATWNAQKPQECNAVMRVCKSR
ncbi:ankyrin repeat-containing domain protein [Tricladium varicosporioides]|nr:ankyrin repeat-containing domain protein [Hymenoscyphus varicosporioides]